MGKEIYLRDPSDPAFKENILEVSDEVEMLVSQIKLMLFSKPGDVLGAFSFGVDLDSQLFVFNINEYNLKSMLNDQTAKFIPLSEKYRVKYDVKFAQGTVRDICIIDVSINGTPFFGLMIK